MKTLDGWENEIRADLASAEKELRAAEAGAVASQAAVAAAHAEIAEIDGLAARIDRRWGFAGALSVRLKDFRVARRSPEGNLTRSNHAIENARHKIADCREALRQIEDMRRPAGAAPARSQLPAISAADLGPPHDLAAEASAALAKIAARQGSGPIIEGEFETRPDAPTNAVPVTA